ncbi:MAG: alginate export family protein [Candidatus Euphemobacter frigidus]|nr:alginate export family protein [Candidatus Euphemobacter frigidus]MDP8275680.1 alginate export family protein [Candidatus Euphemobacter frigidus]
MMKKAILAIGLAVLILPVPLRAGLLEKDVIQSDWFKVGGDFRIREVGFNNIIVWNSDNKADQQHFWRLRTRLYFQADPMEELTLYSRFVNEWRYYAKPKNREHPLRDEILLDNAYLNIKGVGDIPLVLKAGRQDLIYGEGFIILDGTPLDGSRTIFCDGGKITLDLDQTTVDFLALYNTGKQWFAINKNTDPLGGGDSERLDSQTIGVFGAYLTNKSLIEKQKLEAYYLYKHGLTSEVDPEKWPNNDINVIGARLSGPVNDRIKYAGEATLQLGEYGDNSMTAFGGYAHGTYTLIDVSIKPALTLEYVYLSGDNPNKQNYKGWDPVLARWPKWSELYIYSQIPEKDIAYWTNMQIYRAKLSARPIDKMSVNLVYQYLRANNAGPGTGVFGNGKDRGQNPQFILKYAFNDWLSGHLWGEYFMPGNFYSGDDAGFFARWQLMAKF